MAFKKKARHFYGRVKRHVRRHKTGISGVMGDVLAGGIIGGIAGFAEPTINTYVPSFMGLRPKSIALVGGGVIAKAFLHKGGKFADAAIIIGTAGIASDLAGGMAGSTTSGGWFG